MHVPSAREFVHEFVGHYVALEGRLWKSLYFLLCKPGFLTAEYIAGRRKRYVEPLRLYLTFSIVFFALVKIVDAPLAQFDEAPAAPVQSQPAATVAGPARPAAPALPGASPATPNLASKEPASIKRDLKFERVVIGFSPTLEKHVNEFIDKPHDEKNRILGVTVYSYVPYAMFLLMPVFALYLKLLYLGSGRRYGEHFLFALHSNAFAFFTFGLLICMNRIGFGLAEAALVLWLVIYLPTAMRRVYGGGRILTALRWVVLGTVHVVSIAGAVVAAFAMALIS